MTTNLQDTFVVLNTLVAQQLEANVVLKFKIEKSISDASSVLAFNDFH